MQLSLAFEDVQEEVNVRGNPTPFKAQLLKWIGNKQRLAPAIIRQFPAQFGTYREPFLGSGGVLGVLSPLIGVGSDSFTPLIEIWQTLKKRPELLKLWYKERHDLLLAMGKEPAYEAVKANYNRTQNAADLLYLSRSCYGGVVRFRQRDGYMSTPCGVHDPISPASFAARVEAWSVRVAGTDFVRAEYQDAFRSAAPGDLVYCDPPYSFSQAILYGAQGFDLAELYGQIRIAKQRGVFVALSIDGTKKSGGMNCDVNAPEGLFARELAVNVGRSMLKRFQMEGQSLEAHHVTDRLLLTY